MDSCIGLCFKVPTSKICKFASYITPHPSGSTRRLQAPTMQLTESKVGEYEPEKPLIPSSAWGLIPTRKASLVDIIQGTGDICRSNKPYCCPFQEFTCLVKKSMRTALHWYRLETVQFAESLESEKKNKPSPSRRWSFLSQPLRGPHYVLRSSPSPSCTSSALKPHLLRSCSRLGCPVLKCILQDGGERRGNSALIAFQPDQRSPFIRRETPKAFSTVDYRFQYLKGKPWIVLRRGRARRFPHCLTCQFQVECLVSKRSRVKG